MKISEFITELENFKLKHGDLEVKIWSNYDGERELEDIADLACKKFWFDNEEERLVLE